jgi:hypothetical protein
MPKPLTVQVLQKEASGFAKAQSKHAEPSLFGVTDGKAIGTYLEHKFQTHLQSRFAYGRRNSAKGIDFPGLGVDIKDDEHPAATIVVSVQKRPPENLRSGLLAARIRL